jgi:hypothetical protein
MRGWQVSASAYGVASACPRRLRRTLDPEYVGQRFPEKTRMFLLRNALVGAISEAHDRHQDNGTPLEAALDAAVADALSLPTGLLPEEQAALAAAAEAYGDSVAGRSGHFAGTVSDEWRSPTGRYRLTASTALLFDLPDGGIEVRRVRLQPRHPSAPSPAATGYAQVTALVLRGDPFTRFVDVHVAGDATLVEGEITFAELPRVREDVHALVTGTMDDEDPAARPTRQCHDCPHMSGCPGIITSSLQQVFA